jgi:hypothetical protein
MTKIKQVETVKFSISLEESEDLRYVIRYKRNSMKGYAHLDFKDYSWATKVFEDTLVTLEGR